MGTTSSSSGKAFNLRLDETLAGYLEALSAEFHMSGQDVLRQALIEKYDRDRHERSIEGAFERVEARWSGVLDRLGRA